MSRYGLTYVKSICIHATVDKSLRYILDPAKTEDMVLTTSISNYLSITDNTASCLSTVVGYYNVTTKIRIEQTLQKKNGSSWSDKVIFTNTYNTNVAIYSTQKSGLASGTYRLKTVAKVYSGDDYETVTKYSSTHTC